MSNPPTFAAVTSEPVLGRWSVLGLVLNSVIGAGIFGLPSLVARSLGGAAPWAFLLSLCLIGPGVAVFAWLAAGLRETGGQYIYVRNVLGETWGTVVGWFIVLVRLSSAAAVTNLFIAYLGELLPSTGAGVPRALALTLVVGSLGVANFRGIRHGVGLSNVLTLAKVAALTAFVVIGLLCTESRTTAPLPQQLGASNWFEALLALTFAYGGFDNALIPTGETRDPQRATPLALCVGMAIVSVLYVLVQVVCMWSVPDLAHTERPLAAAARSFAGVGGGVAISVAALASTFGWLSAAFVAVPRLIAAMATGGALPRALAGRHARFQTPHIGTLFWSAAVLLLALGNGFVWNAQLSAGARLVTYFTAALLVFHDRYRRRGPAILFAASLSLVVCAVLVSQLQWAQVWVLVFVCVLAVGYRWLLNAVHSKPSGMAT
ncbi:MAG: hypothetical protein RL033_2182 [Pseudomonadota bacterium]